MRPQVLVIEKFNKEQSVLGVGLVKPLELSLGIRNRSLHAGYDVPVRGGAL